MSLPKKPSELIKLALEDLMACESDDRYSIDMLTFHALHKGMRTCSVCLSGAVMAKSLHAPFGECVVPSDFNFKNQNKLFALDEFRNGDIGLGLIFMFTAEPYLIRKRPTMKDWLFVPDYHEDRDGFFEAMNEISHILRESSR